MLEVLGVHVAMSSTGRRAARRMRAGSLYNLGIQKWYSAVNLVMRNLTELDLLDSESSQIVITSNILIPMLVKL